MKTNIIAAGGLVENERSELLLIFRRGKWDLPKGKIDKGETIRHCALREVEEETGLQNIELGELLQVTYHEYADPWLKQDVIKETHWFAMKVKGDQLLVPQAEEDITEIKWVKKNALENYLANSYKNIVEVIRKYIGHE